MEKQPLNEPAVQPAAPPPYQAGGPSQQPYPSQPQQYPGQPQQYPPGQPQPYPGQSMPPSGPYPVQPGGAPPPEYKADMPPGQAVSPGHGPPPGAVVQPATTVIVQQQRFNQFPANCVCPNCHQNVVTSTVAETSLLTWLICGAIILFGGWVCCLCLIPFCIDDLKDVRHVCPSCRHTIHVYKRM